MKKTVKILSVLLGFILAFTPILSLTASADDAANGVTSTYNQTYENANRKLVITEMSAGGQSGSTMLDDYQFIEILNISKEDVSLDEYYLYRYGANVGNWDSLGLEFILGLDQGSAKQVARLKITDDESAVVNAGTCAVLWMRKSESTLTEADFKTFWKDHIADGTNIIPVDFPVEYMAGTNATHNIDNVQYASAGFLPSAGAQVIVLLLHENASFTNSQGSSIKIADETITVTTHGQGAVWSDNYARIQIADSCALFCSGVDTRESTYVSHNYYGYVNDEKYDAYDGTKFEGDFTSFVSGKLAEDGTYDPTNALGLELYKGADADDVATYFFDDGTKTTATPGTLNAGQFGYNSIKVLGYQTNNENDLRIVASFEADALMANAVGFEIVANIGGTEKTLDKECYKVYAKLGGSVKVGDETVSPLDQAYLATVGAHDYYVALTITDIDTDVTFTVKPYVLNGTLKEYGETATVTYTAPQA